MILTKKQNSLLVDTILDKQLFSKQFLIYTSDLERLESEAIFSSVEIIAVLKDSLCTDEENWLLVNGSVNNLIGFAIQVGRFRTETLEKKLRS